MLLVSYQELDAPKRDVPRSHAKATESELAKEPTKQPSEAVKDAAGENVDARKVDEGDESPAEKKPAYTSPGLPYQQLAVAVAVAAVGAVADDEAKLGRAFSESVAFSDAGSIGRLGLTAPPTRLAGRVTSRPGLQEGPATGLGFAALDRNIFTPQINRLSGATGRCQDLARAGFFGGSRAGCEQSFRGRSFRRR